MTVRWPVAVLRPQNVAFDLAPRSLAGPSSVSGKTQVVSSDAGIWKATFGNIVIRRREEVLMHRALAAILEGRAGTILVPLCRAYQPIPADIAGMEEETPHEDGSFFDDGSGYVGAIVDVSAQAPAPVRAVSMTVTVTRAGDIQPGQHFSIRERLYRIRGFDASTGAMTFRPPLREAVSVGEALNFDDPVCRMRLATDDAMDLDLSLRRFGTPTVNFIEDV